MNIRQFVRSFDSTARQGGCSKTIGDLASIIVALATAGSLIYISRRAKAQNLNDRDRMFIERVRQLDKSARKPNSATMTSQGNYAENCSATRIFL